MSPEERADALWQKYGRTEDGDSIWPGTIYLAAAIRDAEADAVGAALRERDAQWRKAIDLERQVRANVFHLTEAECQDFLAPLRALLQAPPEGSEGGK